MSTTCNKRSASRTSSSVLLNASTSCVGSFRINPTVSVSRNGKLPITTFRTVVSSVAKACFQQTLHFCSVHSSPSISQHWYSPLKPLAPKNRDCPVGLPSANQFFQDVFSRGKSDREQSACRFQSLALLDHALQYHLAVFLSGSTFPQDEEVGIHTALVQLGSGRS